MKLHNIEQEAADCRAANADAKIGDPLLHIHHGSEAVGRLTEPVENRIAYILKHKPKEEQALRLRLMRRVTEAQAAAYFGSLTKAATAPACATFFLAVVAAHRAICVPDCPWDGRSIFS